MGPLAPWLDRPLRQAMEVEVEGRSLCSLPSNSQFMTSWTKSMNPKVPRKSFLSPPSPSPQQGFLKVPSNTGGWLVPQEPAAAITSDPGGSVETMLIYHLLVLEIRKPQFTSLDQSHSVGRAVLLLEVGGRAQPPPASRDHHAPWLGASSFSKPTGKHLHISPCLIPALILKSLPLPFFFC